MKETLIVYPDGTDKPGVEFKCANGFVSRVVSVVAEQNIPDAERVCQILNAADTELTSAKARLIARSKAMLWMRDVLINIRDDLDEDVDRVYFGSTNDADDFKDIVRQLDDWQWSAIMEDTKGEDLIEELCALHARLAQIESILAEAREAVGMFSMPHFQDGEVLARIDLPDRRTVQFRGGDGFFGNPVFFEATRICATVSAKIVAMNAEQENGK